MLGQQPGEGEEGGATLAGVEVDQGDGSPRRGAVGVGVDGGMQDGGRSRPRFELLEPGCVAHQKLRDAERAGRIDRAHAQQVHQRASGESREQHGPVAGAQLGEHDVVVAIQAEGVDEGSFADDVHAVADALDRLIVEQHGRVMAPSLQPHEDRLDRSLGPRRGARRIAGDVGEDAKGAVPLWWSRPGPHATGERGGLQDERAAGTSSARDGVHRQRSPRGRRRVKAVRGWLVGYVL